MVRPGPLALIAILCASLGALASLAVARGAGWLGRRDTTSVVVRTPAQVEPQAVAASAPAPRVLPARFDAEQVYAARAAGVVTLYAFFGSDTKPSEASQGSGFVVSRDGYVVTSSHVITNAGEATHTTGANHVYVEFSDGDRVPARIVGWDVYDDVGVLKVDPRSHELAPVPLGNSSAVAVGEPVAAIGSPFGKQDSLAVGVVSAVHRSIDSLTSDYAVADAIQTDAAINHGNSGGPLFDAAGRVIGINAQIRSDTGNSDGVGFAIPIDAARRSLRQLVATGRVSYSYLGVSTQDLTPSAARHFGFVPPRGAVIVSVQPRSPAARAGLRAATEEVFFNGDPNVPRDGDVIVAVNGHPVDGADDVIRTISDSLPPGAHARLTIFRGAQRRTVVVTLARRTDTPA